MQGVLLRAYSVDRDPDVPPPSTLLILLGWAACAAGILVKFPVVPGVALVTIIGLAIWDRGDARWLRNLQPGRGFLLLLVFFAIPAFSTRLLQVLAPTDTSALSVGEALSALVLIKGFEMTSYAMAHFLLGVHVLDMQSLAPYSRISYISPFIFDANSNDGASILFKGICEYGYLWIALAWRGSSTLWSVSAAFPSQFLQTCCNLGSFSRCSLLSSAGHPISTMSRRSPWR